CGAGRAEQLKLRRDRGALGDVAVVTAARWLLRLDRIDEGVVGVLGAAHDPPRITVRRGRTLARARSQAAVKSVHAFESAARSAGLSRARLPLTSCGAHAAA